MEPSSDKQSTSSAITAVVEVPTDEARPPVGTVHDTTSVRSPRTWWAISRRCGFALFGLLTFVLALELLKRGAAGMDGLW